MTGLAAAGGIAPLFDRPPGLVLFDLDDTLCDYARARDLRLRIAFCGGRADAPPPIGVDLDRLIADSIARQPHGSDHFPELLAAHGVTDPAFAHRAMEWFRANRFHGLDLFPDARATIERLRALPAPGGRRRIGIISNGPADVQRAKVGLLGIEEAVDFVLISGEFGVAKPAPEIFHEALRLGGAAADGAVVVGDSLEHDIAGARAAGIASIWVDRHGRRLLPADPRPDRVAGGLADVLTFLGDCAGEGGPV